MNTYQIDDTDGHESVFARPINPIDQLRADLQAHIRDCTASNRKMYWAVISALVYMLLHDSGMIGKILGGH